MLYFEVGQNTIVFQGFGRVLATRYCNYLPNTGGINYPTIYFGPSNLPWLVCALLRVMKTYTVGSVFIIIISINNRAPTYHEVFGPNIKSNHADRG